FLGSKLPQAEQAITTVFFALAMWGPGIAAVVVTKVIAGRPLGDLGLGRLGPRRFYLWAWLLPPLLAVTTGAVTLLFGFGKFDPGFSAIREALAQAPGGNAIPPAAVVGLQVLLALTLAPFFNVLFALGEELGWRAFLLPRLLPLGQWKAIVLTGLIWGLWHAPAILQGLNYPEHPVAGVGMMMVFTTLLSVIFSWLYLNTGSPWAPALAHGSVNASAGLAVLFLRPDLDLALGGTLASVSGWVGMTLFVGWLVVTRRLPVRVGRGTTPRSGSEAGEVEG
ncbi:MAG: CPBP family intramembrane metalloprotease, partial [Anaerolineae bacterium]